MNQFEKQFLKQALTKPLSPTGLYLSATRPPYPSIQDVFKDSKIWDKVMEEVGSYIKKYPGLFLGKPNPVVGFYQDEGNLVTEPSSYSVMRNPEAAIIAGGLLGKKLKQDSALAMGDIIPGGEEGQLVYGGFPGIKPSADVVQNFMENLIETGVSGGTLHLPKGRPYFETLLGPETNMAALRSMLVPRPSARKTEYLFVPGSDFEIGQFLGARKAFVAHGNSRLIKLKYV